MEALTLVFFIIFAIVFGILCLLFDSGIAWAGIIILAIILLIAADFWPLLLIAGVIIKLIKKSE